jgi:HK97 gp10 family phage protein
MAADGANYDMTGLPELLGKLEALEFDIKRKGGRFALRRAAQVLRDQARANAERVDDPSTSETIAANIVERWSGRTFKKTGNMMFRVGVMGGAGGSAQPSSLADLPGGDTRHWRQLEFGNERMPAQPIFRPVPDQVGQQATDVFVKEYGKSIDRALKRAKKKAVK